MAFARDMEAALKKRDATKGDSWKTAPKGHLIYKIHQKETSLEFFGNKPEGQDIIIDLANYLMFFRKQVQAELAKNDPGAPQ